MGLDGVEILMDVEDAFDIQIVEGEIAKLATPRDLIDVVTRKVAHADAAACLTQRAFNQLRAALLHQLPLKRRDITPRARMAVLAPKDRRKALLERLAAELQTPPMPALVRPRGLVPGLVGCSVLLSLIIAGFLFRDGLWEHRSALFATALIVAVGSGILAIVATAGCCTEFPPLIETVGNLARWIVGHKSGLDQSGPGKWTREQVAERIRAITIEHLNCAQAYREDASFVRDLGMG